MSSGRATKRVSGYDKVLSGVIRTLRGQGEVELIEPLEGPSIYKEFLAEKGGELHHGES